MRARQPRAALSRVAPSGFGGHDPRARPALRRRRPDRFCDPDRVTGSGEVGETVATAVSDAWLSAWRTAG
jgi:hypothetical protein